MPKHFDRIICPVCHKPFGDASALRAHQKSKRHFVQTTGATERRRSALVMEKYHRDKMKTAKFAEGNKQ